MTDQSPPIDPAVSQDTSGAADTAKKLAEQAIDVAAGLGKLAVDVPKDTAKLALSELKKVVAKLEDVLG